MVLSSPWAVAVLVLTLVLVVAGAVSLHARTLWTTTSVLRRAFAAGAPPRPVRRTQALQMQVATATLGVILSIAGGVALGVITLDSLARELGTPCASATLAWVRPGSPPIEATLDRFARAPSASLLERLVGC